MQFKINNKYTRILCILLVIAWMVFIFCMSAQGSDDSKRSSGFFTKLVNLLFGIEEGTEAFNVLTTVVRKCAHIFEFAMLSALSLVTLCHYEMKYRARVISSFGFTVFYAATDEIHQFFGDGRACRFTDVLIDAFGGALGILFVTLIFYIYLKHRKGEKK